MNIFTEIEGLSGEELSSALLRYLLLNSSEARENIISFFSKHSPIGPLISYSHFSCNREYPTQYEDRKSEQEKVRGRIDLLIELDGAIIGIENKLFANFGDDQPKKYLQTLEDIRSTLSKIRLPKMKSAFFVLCPEFKENDAREKISDLKTPSKVVLWEKLISNLKQIEKITDPVSRVVLDELIIYIERKIDFLHDFSDWVPHLRNHFESKGSELQREVLRNIWKVSKTVDFDKLSVDTNRLHLMLLSYQ